MQIILISLCFLFVVEKTRFKTRICIFDLYTFLIFLKYNSSSMFLLDNVSNFFTFNVLLFSTYHVLIK